MQSQIKKPFIDNGINRDGSGNMGKKFAYCYFTKVWNHVNLSIFASSEAETCSTSIAMTRCSIFIILVVSESPH